MRIQRGRAAVTGEARGLNEPLGDQQVVAREGEPRGNPEPEDLPLTLAVCPRDSGLAVESARSLAGPSVERNNRVRAAICLRVGAGARDPASSSHVGRLLLLNTSRSDALWCACAVAALSPITLAQGYALVGTYPAPGGAMDVLPDGRLVALDGDTIRVQDAVNTPSYSPIGSIPSGLVNASFGASFLSVNPSGTTIAIGDNDAGFGPQDVLLVDVASLSTSGPTAPTVIASSNTSGAWADDTTLYVSGAASFGDPGTLTRIDVPTSGAAVVVDGLNGASGGVSVFGGSVYTGNGFGSGTGFDATGAIAGFDLAALSGASSSVAFSSGDLIATALSAGTLAFDAAGNLLVGGSNVFGGGEGGFVSVIPSSAFPGATSADGQRLVPGTGAFGFPGAWFNGATDEILVRDGGTIYRYAVPAPGAMAISLVALGWRRRRRA